MEVKEIHPWVLIESIYSHAFYRSMYYTCDYILEQSLYRSGVKSIGLNFISNILGNIDLCQQFLDWKTDFTRKTCIKSSPKALKLKQLSVFSASVWSTVTMSEFNRIWFDILNRKKHELRGARHYIGMVTFHVW